MSPDKEINALGSVYETLKGLNNAQIMRIIEWITSKFSLDKQDDFKAGSPEVVSPPPQGSAVKKRRGRKPAKTGPVFEAPHPQAAAGEMKGFLKYNTFEDLFFASTAKTITAKILMAAAYLQETKKLKEFGSHDINILMKKIGQDVPNISSSINILLMKKSPLLIQKRRGGTSKQSRRTYEVTEEGLRLAMNYIKG